MHICNYTFVMDLYISINEIQQSFNGGLDRNLNLLKLLQTQN